jgi:hypothetical protein
MAKQDLYKTAQQSAKLFKLIQDEQLLESWVKNKIISAAEDISTVYQYLNYEKQFRDYSQMIAESTDLSDSKRAVLTSKLAEAKDKVKELKKKAAKDKSEKMSEDKDEMKVGDTKKTRTGELTKTSTGVVHKNTSYHDDGDEIASNAKSGKGVKSHAKAETAAEKKEKAPAQKFSPKSAKTYGMKDGEKFDNRDKVDEAKPTKFDKSQYDGDREEPAGSKSKPHPKGHLNQMLRKKLGEPEKKVDEAKAKCCCEEKGKAKCPVHGKVDEAKTMSRAAKGNEKYGKDGMKALAKAGREGKSLEPIKAKYNKYDEGAMPMKKVGGKSVPAFAADGKGKNDLAKKKASDKVKEAIARAKDVLEGKTKKKKDMIDMEGNAVTGGLADKSLPIGSKIPGTNVIKKKQIETEGKTTALKESTELDRMKVIMQRLNG